MKQADLNRAVARATGESVGRIARLGFCLLLLPTAYAAGKKAGNRCQHNRPRACHGRWRRNRSASPPTENMVHPNRQFISAGPVES